MPNPYEEYQPGYGGYTWGSDRGQDPNIRRRRRQSGPDYSEAQRFYDRMMDMESLDKLRASRMADWKQMQQRAFGDIAQGVASRWGGTGANVLGIESSLPAQWETQAGTRWMQDVGTPGMRSIEQEYEQNAWQRQQAAMMGEQELRNRAEAEWRAKKSSPWGTLGTIAGGISGFLLGGPAGAAAGAGLGGSIFDGGGQQNYQSPSYNPYFDPQWMNMQGQPMYQNQGQWI